MDDEAIQALEPSRFMDPRIPQETRDRIDSQCRETFRAFRAHCFTIDPSRHNNGAFDIQYYVRRFDAAAFYTFPLLQALSRNLSAATALDIGSGLGLIALGLCAGFKKYVGVEIDSASIEEAKTLHFAAGTSNCSFHLMNAEVLPQSIAKIGFDRRPDVIVMAASLEHLTPQERTPIYDFLRTMLKQGSLVLIVDTPNRLNPFDGHSTDLHFIQMLPDYLASLYTKRSPRKYTQDFFKELDWRKEDERWQGPRATELLYRLGRAVSYHDFDIYLGDIKGLGIAIDGWDPLRLNFQPPTRSEAELEDYFKYNCPEVHSAYSRFWVDLGLSVDLRQTPQRTQLVRPEAQGPVTLYKRPYWYSLDDYYAAGPTACLIFKLPGEGISFVSLIINGTLEDQRFEVLGDGASLAKIDLLDVAKRRPPTWHAVFVLPVLIPRGIGELTLRPASGSQCTCQGLLVH